ncbi:MAG TPA: protein kinase [Bryobacteraceae bacterium]|nr:protein kinase [Bryobacteraceae bacterium]
MALSTGTKLGPYEILAPLGAGGMGEVYRAHDPRMGRQVAIKISAERFSARFSREVHSVAALNHPNICHLYDVGPDYLVMELVEGPTLAERLTQGPVPLDEALQIARQIGDALEDAHEKGIIHRDLKPGNIMLRPDGTVKVLDFGLAKVTDQTASGERAEHSQSLTVDPISRVGVVVGTAAYMPPEQARGKLVDKRADIWAFGVILFEMLTGERLFAGETVSDTLIEVATKEPDWERIPAKAQRLLRRCLEKDPKKRLRDIGDAWFWLEDAVPEGAVTAMAYGKKSGRWRLPVTLAAIASLMAAAFAAGHYTRKLPDARAIRFSFAPPFKTHAINLALSPDGTRIASSGIDEDHHLWLSSIDSSNAQKQPGTEGAMSLFWSPDGRSVGFVSGGVLQRLNLDSPQSPPQTVTSPANPFAGAAWSPRGVILFQVEQAGSGLSRVPAGGGAPAPATHLNAARKEIVHRYPQFLPDGRHFIYWVWSALEENTGEYIGSLDAAEKLPDGPLVRTWREAHYADSGYLLYLEGKVLMARPFNASGLRFTGEARALPEQIGRHWGTTGHAMFSVSSRDALIYQEVLPQGASRISVRSRSGNVLRTIEAPAGSQFAAVDPSGTHVAVQGLDENTVEDIWTIDLERGLASRLTARQGSNQRPVWSPDGQRIAFMSNRAGAYDLYARNANGTGEDELLVKSPHTKFPAGWSADGKYLLYVEGGNGDMLTSTWLLPMEGDRKPIPFLNTGFNVDDAKLSPVLDDLGRQRIAYVSNETGSREVYVRPFPSGGPGAAGPVGPAIRVSTAGGYHPFWRKDGRELFYSVGPKQMAVDVTFGKRPEIGIPHSLFDLDLNSVSADGQRFLHIEDAAEMPAARISVVLNWTAELAGK